MSFAAAAAAYLNGGSSHGPRDMKVSMNTMCLTLSSVRK